MNAYAVIVVTSVLIGLVCAAIAQRTNRDPLRWFFIGALLNVAALALLAFIAKRRATHVTARG
jgi:hypothetical protein